MRHRLASERFINAQHNEEADDHDSTQLLNHSADPQSWLVAVEPSALLCMSILLWPSLRCP